MMTRMYSGQWTGTMALTEPQAGSSLTDVKTKARRAEGGHYLLRGNKVFISGGDHDLTENIVHLTLARIDGAPAGIKGVSLFAVPKKRLESGKARSRTTCTAQGAFHKVGWRSAEHRPQSRRERRLSRLASSASTAPRRFPTCSRW